MDESCAETRQECVVGPEADGQRLDVFLATCPGVTSRAAGQRLLTAGLVQLEHAVGKARDRVAVGNLVRYAVPAAAPAVALPEEIPLAILYEDADLIVVDKPRGMVVHPAVGNFHGTLVNAVLGHAGDLSGVGGVLRPGIVHRLDKDTSGVMVVAKNDLAHLALAAQFKARTIRRIYLALAVGSLPQDEGQVAGNIGRHPKDRKRMAVVARGGKPAVTHWRTLGRAGGYSLLAVRLETGRTHQIRVHLAHLGHPVAGDPVYGRRRGELGLEGQALHAALLGFTHPRTGAWLEFRTPPPGDFVRALQKLGLAQAEELEKV